MIHLVRTAGGDAMNSQTVWMLLVSLLLVCGMIRGGEKPEPFIESPEAASKEPESVAWQLPPGARRPAIAPFDADHAKQHQHAWAKYLGVPAVETNSIGMKLKLIAVGEFMMGSSESVDIRVSPREKPLHRVRITKPFYLGVYEVTVGQFRQFVEATGYKTEAEKDGKGGFGWNESEDKFGGRSPKYTWRNPGRPQADASPLANVSWTDAVAFCRWLSGKEGKSHRLPTEAEWDSACRAGTTTLYSFGGDTASLEEYAWYFDNSDMKTHTVGQTRPNAWGLYDMHGNVYEFCADRYDVDYYAISPAGDPQGPETGQYRVIRGGGCNEPAWFCRAAYRQGGHERRDCFYNLGFRVAADPSGAQDDD